jgi:LacI family transcriptional regulator
MSRRRPNQGSSSRAAVNDRSPPDVQRAGPVRQAGAQKGPGPVTASTPGVPEKRVTIREVATLARVSLGTVSNVLNNPSVVAPVTRGRVLDAISSTGFVRSTAAHQLRVGKSRTIGVVLLDIANPFFAEMVRGIEHVLRERDYVVILCSSDESAQHEQRYFRVLEEHRVDGLLVSPVERDLEGVAALVAHGIPTVLLDHDGTSRGLCSVSVDDVRGAELAADHLFALGHRAIAFVNGPAAIRQCMDRREGARRSVRRARRRGTASLREIVVGALVVEQGEAAVAALLDLEPRPSAVMCANDLLALGVLRGLASAGIAVPTAMAVVGYDDVAFASMLSPALTSVRQPKYDLGVVAAQLLLEEVAALPHEHRAIRFEPELVVRASSSSSPLVPARTSSTTH